MGRSIVLKLRGNLSKDSLQVSAEIGELGGKAERKLSGSLPSCPSLLNDLEQWRKSYRQLDAPFRLRFGAVRHTSLLKDRQQNCQQQAEALANHLTDWLDVHEFREIEAQLRAEMERSSAVEILLHAQDRRLCQLPWHEWKLLQDDRCMGIAFSTSTRQQIPERQPNNKLKVRVLAILGDSRGIDVAADRRALSRLPNAEVTFLVEPYRYEIEERLKQQWDVLFFAGHSETQEDQGRLYINASDSLSINELRKDLSHCIQQGLQIAIFNSCDGLGLAYQLEELSIPYLIVMREPVPDRVAQKFAESFLESFSSGYSFWEAQRDARKALQRFESEFPCATWMPIVFQNPAALLQNWGRLSGDEETPGDAEKKNLDKISGQEILPGPEKEIHEHQVRSFFELVQPDRKVELLPQPVDAIILGVSQKRKHGKVRYRIRYAASDWFANLIIKDNELPLQIGEEISVVARIGITLLFLPKNCTLIPSDLCEPRRRPGNSFIFPSLRKLLAAQRRIQ